MNLILKLIIEKNKNIIQFIKMGHLLEIDLSKKYLYLDLSS